MYRKSLSARPKPLPVKGKMRTSRKPPSAKVVIVPSPVLQNIGLSYREQVEYFRRKGLEQAEEERIRTTLPSDITIDELMLPPQSPIKKKKKGGRFASLRKSSPSATENTVKYPDLSSLIYDQPPQPPYLPAQQLAENIKLLQSSKRKGTPSSAEMEKFEALAAEKLTSFNNVFHTGVRLALTGKSETSIV